mmetsp:Transcript_40617/g.77565  ORF Transcript_40617/g.77565 Transcript_40617/m.77565 type:complete len:226 (-) Transcript_40617:1683-2360(-)
MGRPCSHHPHQPVSRALVRVSSAQAAQRPGAEGLYFASQEPGGAKHERCQGGGVRLLRLGSAHPRLGHRHLPQSFAWLQLCLPAHPATQRKHVHTAGAGARSNRAQAVQGEAASPGGKPAAQQGPHGAGGGDFARQRAPGEIHGHRLRGVLRRDGGQRRRLQVPRAALPERHRHALPHAHHAHQVLGQSAHRQRPVQRHNQLLRFDADDHFPSAADAASSVPPPE